MARKNNDNNPIQFRLRVISLPKSVKHRQLYRRLMELIRYNKPLPPKWVIELHWRNPATRHYQANKSWKWRSLPFAQAIAGSRNSFNDFVYAALAQRLRHYLKHNTLINAV